MTQKDIAFRQGEAMFFYRKKYGKIVVCLKCSLFTKGAVKMFVGLIIKETIEDELFLDLIKIEKVEIWKTIVIAKKA